MSIVSCSNCHGTGKRPAVNGLIEFVHCESCEGQGFIRPMVYSPDPFVVLETRNAALDAAAKACDELAAQHVRRPMAFREHYQRCAKAIRALKQQLPQSHEGEKHG